MRVVRAYVFLSRDPAGREGALSAIPRLWEEYGVDEFIIIATGAVSEGVIELVRWWAERLVGRDRVLVERIESSPEALRGGSDSLVQRLLGVFRRDCVDSVVLVSSAGRWLAAAAAVAGVRASEDCRIDVVHVHFYFGPWKGLVYPYTPLRLEPVIFLHPVVEPKPRGETAASRMPQLSLSGGYCGWPARASGRLPPLRCAVAELARRINAALQPPFSLPAPRGWEGCGKLVVELAGDVVAAADLCREREVARLAGKLATRVRTLEELGLEHSLRREYPIRSALAWSGLAHLRARDPEGREYSFPELAQRETVIVDTVLVYYGAHRYVWEGGRILLPECAVREIHGRLAEAVKRGRLNRGSDFADALAYLALEDMLGAGAPIAPTPAGECDTAMPKMDPVILEGKVLATADDGAFRYWSRHPASRLATPVKVSFDPDEAERQEIDPARRPQDLSRLYYSVYQALLFYALLDSQCVRSVHPFRVKVLRPDGEEVQVKPPLSIILKSLGLEARKCEEGR